MSQQAELQIDKVLAAPVRRSKFSFAWLGVVPFFLFTLMFLILPTLDLIVGAFRTPDGAFTLDNIRRLNQPTIISAYWISLQVSIASSVLGAIVGFFMAHAVVMGKVPRWLRPIVTTFSGVASQFAGIPLAFAFLATLGPTGLVTVMLTQYFGINLRALGFNVLSFWGLTITYLYFQIPLMILILMPALDGLKREWREASAILGASTFQFWRYVALPVLWPSAARHDDPSFRQRLRGGSDRLRAHRIVPEHRTDPPLCADQRRRAP